MDRIVRMHTAEHILTAIMRRQFGSPKNLEMHLGDKKTKCDYEVDTPIGEAEIQTIERAVNDEIEKDHDVSVLRMPRSEAEARFDLWKVPPDVETIRVVRIACLDETPCSGEHVATTGHVGVFHIRSASMRSERVVRIRFGLEDAA